MDSNALSKTLYIVDGSSLLYRSFYGLSRMHTSRGEPVHAVYGFCRAIKKIIDDFSPALFVIVWDAPGKTTRKEFYAEYKATRQAIPNDLISQKEAIQEWASALGICQITEQGWEADDVIAHLVRTYTEGSVLIIGPDKDLHQLISHRVEMYDPMKKKRYTQDEIEKKYGFEVAKIPFYYALVGDSSDNIPGVKGIGPKGATELVTSFESIDDLYKNIDAVTNASLKKKLLENEANARLSYQLFLLGDPDVAVDKKECAFDVAWWSKGYPFFKQYEFKSLLPANYVDVQNQGHKDQGKAILVLDEAELIKICEKVKKHGFCALDTETNGLVPLDEPLVGFSVAYNDQEAFYIPLQHEGEGSDRQISYERGLEIIKPILLDESIKKVFHSAKFDMHVFDHVGIEVKGLYFDTIVAASLLRTDAESLSLKSLSARMLQEPMQTFAEVLGKRKNFAYVPLEQATEYAARDALQTYKLWRHFEKGLEAASEIKKLFFELEMPLCSVLFSMEKAGILLDVPQIHEIKKSVDKKIAHVQQKIVSFLEAQGIENGAFINLNAPRQIETLLFDQLGLTPRGKSAKGARSTNQEVLQALSKEHPIPRLIVEYREVMKLKSTYVEPLPLLVQKRTGRIHTSFNQNSVITGRLSSNDPNMQNIPVSHEEGLDIRKAFVASEGKSFISADYSQIELRVLAYVTKDPALVEAFLHNQDIHAKTAAQIFDVPLDAVSNEQRQIGKRINFSIMYGMTPYGLSKDLDISMSDARKYIDAYFDRYHGVKEWMDVTVAQAQERGYVSTLWGRRRYIPELQERNKMLFEAGKRAAINTPIQGTTSELIKKAMIAIDQYCNEQSHGAQLLLQIHDEVLLEVPDENLAAVGLTVQKIMEQVVDWNIPLKVTIRTGKDWSEVTK